MSHSFDLDGLWIKSRLFINRALDEGRGFEERAFWACSALELLGKYALARITPLLIANPVDDGHSLLVASGVIDGNATSVQAKAVWSRCHRVFKPFNEKEAKLLSVGRNEYIHAAGVGFDSIPSFAWWPRFWSQAVILLRHMDLTLEDYVDQRHLGVANKALASHQETLKQQFEAKIARARTMRQQADNETLSPRQLKEWELRTFYITRYHCSVECPACEGDATLYGDEVVEQDIHYFDHDTRGDPGVSVTLQIAPMALTCDRCRLELDDYDLLAEAGLETNFEVEGSGDDIEYEPEYNNE